MTSESSPLLWLAFEKPPHANAVVAGVRVADAEFLQKLLTLPRRRRVDYAVQFRNFLSAQTRRSAFAIETVTCRLPDGECHFIDWRLAKWLSHVLPADDSVIARTAKRIHHWLQHHWLQHHWETVVVRP